MNRVDAEEFMAAHGRAGEAWWRMSALGIRLGVPEALGVDRAEYGARLGGYFKLPIEERQDAVAELSEQGMTQREIAGVLGVSVGTVNGDVTGRSELNTPPEESEVSEVDRSELNTPEPEPTLDEAASLIDKAGAVADLIDTVKKERRPKPKPAPRAHPVAAFLWARLSEVRALHATKTSAAQRSDVTEVIEMWSKELDRLHQEVAP